MNAIPRQLALCLALQLCCAPVHAHAFLERASPAVGSSVRTSPIEIRLWSSAPLDAASSALKVLDKRGRRVDRNDKQLDPRDPAQIRVSVPPLAGGTYRVVWHLLSVDAHASDGDYTFEVVP